MQYLLKFFFSQKTLKKSLWSNWFTKKWLNFCIFFFSFLSWFKLSGDILGCLLWFGEKYSYQLAFGEQLSHSCMFYFSIGSKTGLTGLKVKIKCKFCSYCSRFQNRWEYQLFCFNLAWVFCKNAFIHRYIDTCIYVNIQHRGVCISIEIYFIYKTAFLHRS